MDIKQKSLDALIIMNTVVKNMRLYPPNSEKVVNAVERLHRNFLDMLEKEKSLIFAESEKSILIGGKPLSPQDQEKWQVVAFLKILLKFGVQSITFDKGLGKDELSSFLQILSKKAEVVKSEGGLPRIMKEKNLAHIWLDKKINVAAEKNQQIISGDNIIDDQTIQFLMRAHPESAGNPQKLQEKAKDPGFLLQTFQLGLAELLKQKDKLSKLQISENLVRMITILDKAARSLEKKDQDKISQHIGKSITVLDSDIVQQLKTQKMDQLFGGSLVKYFVGAIAGDKAVKTIVSNEKVSVKTQNPDSGTALEKTSYKTQNPDSGAALEKTPYQNQILNLKETLRSLPKDDQKAFLDEPLMLALPKLFEQLDAQKEHETMAIIIGRLVGNLFSKNDDVRSQASTALADIFADLSHERQNKLIERLSTRLIEWIKIESMATLAYKKICNNLKDLIRDFIREGRFAEAIPILDVFSNISTGILKKNDKAHEISSNIISALASEEHLAILFKAFNTNSPNKQIESGGVLVRLGDGAMNRLLDILRDKGDSDDRVRIMKLFIGIERRAVPVIRDRINKTAPWYYLRNLAYILGQIGNESSASALKPLLLHENKQLRMEALKGVYRTGGKLRGAILLSVLPLADDQFKLNIIETLGNAKCVDAVSELLYLLKERRLVAPSLRADREERICAALGSIGSPEALPALSKIAKSTSFFRIRPYAAKVKIAAGLAVVSIRKKQEETVQATKATEAAQEAKAAEALDSVNVSS